MIMTAAGRCQTKGLRARRGWRVASWRRGSSWFVVVRRSAFRQRQARREAETATGLSSSKSADDERHILPAEAEAVAERVVDALLAGLIGDVVQVAFRIRCLVVDGRRQN